MSSIKSRTVAIVLVFLLNLSASSVEAWGTEALFGYWLEVEWYEDDSLIWECDSSWEDVYEDGWTTGGGGAGRIGDIYYGFGGYYFPHHQDGYIYTYLSIPEDMSIWWDTMELRYVNICLLEAYEPVVMDISMDIQVHNGTGGSVTTVKDENGNTIESVVIGPEPGNLNEQVVLQPGSYEIRQYIEYSNDTPPYCNYEGTLHTTWELYEPTFYQPSSWGKIKTLYH